MWPIPSPKPLLLNVAAARRGISGLLSPDTQHRPFPQPAQQMIRPLFSFLSLCCLILIFLVSSKFTLERKTKGFCVCFRFLHLSAPVCTPPTLGSLWSWKGV